jgi:DNA repair protein RecO (recombination protein O)
MATSERPSSRRTSARAATAPQPAYVLQRHDWSESSLIVELFVRGLGRVVTVARGAKKPTSNFRALLLPFQPVLVLLGRPLREDAGMGAGGGAEASDILPLKSAEWAGGQPLLRGATLFSGFYLNELLLKALPRQDAHPALYDRYAATLAALGEGADEAPVLRAFELALLRETGLLPDLSVATTTAQPLVAEARYTLDAQAGLVPASGAGGLAGARWTALEAALSHGSTAALQAACRGAATALRAPLRELLNYHLGHTPMRTRQVWQGVQQLAQAPS